VRRQRPGTGRLRRWPLSEAAEAEGTPTALRERLDVVVDGSSDALAGLPDDRLEFGATAAAEARVTATENGRLTRG